MYVIVWLKFAVCAGLIFWSASKLTRYGDAIAEKTGLCRAWLGLVVLGAVTSLPELVNAISATAFAGLPDLAAGDLLGACMMNMFSLGVLDLIWGLRGHGTLFLKPKQGNLISNFFGVVILLVVSASLALGHLSIDFSVLGVSIYSAIILGIYLLSLFIISRHRDDDEVAPQEKNHLNLSLWQVYAGFAFAALIVVLASSWLPFIGAEIVEVMGWGKTFVAVLFLALVTTLPEMTVSYSALKMGEVGMAVGNMIGSNVFDVSLIFLADIFYRPASLYAAVSFNMIYAALAGAVLMGIFYFSQRRQTKSHLPSILMIIIYLFALYWLSL